MAETENTAGPQHPVEPVKQDARPAKEPKKKKEKKKETADDISLPILAEFVFAFSVIFLIFVFLAMSTVAWLTGTTLLDFFLRTSVAMLVLGCLFLIISRQVSNGILNAGLAEKEIQAQPEEPETSANPENSENLAIPEAQ